MMALRLPTKSDGFEIAANEIKLGSFKTDLQDHPSRAMYVVTEGGHEATPITHLSVLRSLPRRYLELEQHPESCIEQRADVHAG